MLAGVPQHGYVLGERTIFSAVAELPAGHLVRLGPVAAAERETPEAAAYRSRRDPAFAGLDAQASGRVADEEELEALLRDAVALRMVADVPVGDFLSGGIGSSLVAAMMVAGSANRVRSFSIGFSGKEWDEAQHARAVAEHRRTRRGEHYVGPAVALDVVRGLPGICDEPFAEASMIPTTLLCRMARRGATVALSGDGGDELFGGYRRCSTGCRRIEERSSACERIAGSRRPRRLGPGRGRADRSHEARHRPALPPWRLPGVRAARRRAPR